MPLGVHPYPSDPPIAYRVEEEYKTRTFEATVRSGSSATWSVITNAFGEPDVAATSSAKARGELAALGILVSWETSQGGLIPIAPYTGPPSPANYGGSFQAALTVPFVLSAGDVPDTGLQYFVNGESTRPGSYSDDVTITATWTLDTELWAFDYLHDATESTYLPNPDDPTSLPFDQRGGRAQPDGTPANGREWFEIARLDGWLRCVVVAGDETAEVRMRITEANRFQVTKAFGGGIDYGYRGYIRAITKNATSTASAACDFDGRPLGEAFEAELAGFSVDGEDLSATSTSPDYDVTTYSELSWAVFPRLRYRLTGRFRSGDHAYPGTGLSVSWEVGSGQSAAISGGAASATGHQRRYGYECDLNGSGGPSAGADEWRAMRAHLSGMSQPPPDSDPEHLTRNDREDRYDQALRLRGESWTAGAWTMDASTVIVPAGSGTGSWTGGSAGGLGRVLTGGGTRELGTSERVWESSRYFRPQLRLTAEGSEPRPVTITVANYRISKEYRVMVAPGAAVTPKVDGCSPRNPPEGLEYDHRRNRYPLRYQTLSATSPIATGPEEGAEFVADFADDPLDDLSVERVRGWLWGVNRPTSVSFSCPLAEGETLEVGTVSLVRDEGRLSLVPACLCDPVYMGAYARLWSETAFGGDTTVVGSCLGGPGMSLAVDGRVAFDPALHWRDVPLAGAESWVYLSIADVLAMLPAFPGLDSDVAAFPSGRPWLASSQPAYWLGAEGATHAGGEWSDHHDRAPGSLAAQELFASFYPVPEQGLGHPGGGSGSDAGVFTVAVAKRLRTRAEGIVLDANGAAVDGAVVRTEDVEVGAAASGEGETDGAGRYRTGLPYGRAVRSHETFRALNPGERAERRWRNRWIERVSWLAGVPRGLRRWVALSVSANLQHVLGFPDPAREDRLTLARSDNASPTNFADEYPKDLLLDSLDLCHGPDGSLWGAGASEGTVGLYRASLGTEPRLVTALGPGEYGTLDRSANSEWLVYRLNPIGIVLLRRFDLTESPIGGEEVCTGLPALDQAPIVARCSVSDGAIVVTLACAVGGERRVYRARGGRDFA